MKGSDQLLQSTLAELAANSEGRLKFAQTKVSVLGRELDVKFNNSPNLIYDFKVSPEDGAAFRAVAFTLTLDGSGRGATRAEALGRAIAASDGQLFELNPFLLIYDYAGNQFLAVSALALFDAFVRKVTENPVAVAGTAIFSLTPNFANKTIFMYGKAPEESVWHSSATAGELTLEKIQTGLARVRRETETGKAKITQIVSALKQRIEDSNRPEPQVIPTSDELFHPTIQPLPKRAKIEEDLSTEDGIEEEIIESSETISDPFDPTLIRVERTNPTIELLTKRINRNEINLSPDFQRKGGIWTDEAQSRLIESILIRIPLPAFYVDATDEGNWLVVDGLQRLSTLQRFILKQEFVLKGLEFLHPLEGKKFSELSRAFQRRIEETEVTIFAIQAGTPEEVKFNIFKRINTGGLPLSAQEIRNAINGERVRHFILSLATSIEFKLATQGGIKDKRMADRECVTRFLAFRLTNPKNYPSKDFDAFLNKTMKRLNDPEQISNAGITSLANEFKDAMNRARRVFGRHAFRKYFGITGRISPINKALFEVIAVNLATLSDDEATALIDKKEDVLAGFAELMDDPEFYLAISQGTGAPARVKLRFSKVESLFTNAIHI